MLRIGLVTGEYPPMQGGVGDYSRLMAAAFAGLGHAVTVVTSPPAVGVADGPVRVLPISSRAWGWRDVWRVRRALRGLDVVTMQYQAAAYGKMRPPVHFLPGWIKPPVVMTFHDLRVPYLFPKAGALRWQAVVGMARAADGVIVTNPEDYATLQQAGGVQRLVEIPIGANVDPTPPDGFDIAAWRVARGIPAGAWVVGYFGFLNPSKGGKTLIETVARLVGMGQPVWLVLIGGRTGTADTATNAAYGDEVDDLAAALGVRERVVRTGYLPADETAAALLSCDVMVMPYVDGASFRRGTFMACLNHARATITTRPAVALPQLVHGENIWLIEPGDVEAAAAGVVQLMADAELWGRLGAGAGVLAQAFTWDKIAARQVGFFEEIVLRRGARE